MFINICASRCVRDEMHNARLVFDYQEEREQKQRCTLRNKETRSALQKLQTAVERSKKGRCRDSVRGSLCLWPQ